MKGIVIMIISCTYPSFITSKNGFCYFP